MAGPIPIRQLPQGVAAREPHWYDFLDTSDVADSEDPMRSGMGIPDMRGYTPEPRRHTADIQLGGGLPETPDAPKMFQPAMQGLESARTSMPTPEMSPDDLEMARARAGWSGHEGVDWAAEREGFLAQGNARRQAQDDEYSRMAQTSLMPRGRSANDAAESAAAFRGFQQARNPGFQRQQRDLDTRSGAETFMSPIMAQQRGMQREEALAGKAGETELNLNYTRDPRMREQGALEHFRALALANARNPNNYGGAAATGAPQMYTEQEIRESTLAHGGDENDVLDTLADARARGQLR